MSTSYFVHDTALCESSDIGEKTTIWAFVHILPGARIGRNCNICDHVFIEGDVVIGDNVTVKCGVQLWDGVRIEDNVFIGPNVTFANDLFPRSKMRPEKYLVTVIEKGASLGANATILPGITVGTGAMVGAGSVVTKNVPPYAIVAGNPARIISYCQTDSIDYSQTSAVSSSSANKIIPLNVNKCELWHLPSFTDMRGSITVNEFSENLPFAPKRCFFVYGVESNKIRGEHAHKICEQFLIAVHGKVSALIDDGVKRKEITLDSSTTGLYMPAGTWGVQYNFSSDAVLCVFASHSYSNNDYIRDYSEFIKYIEETKSARSPHDSAIS
jgi:UDP-2-acetamido-3-amino-2,3-dideoxy-glucuronate N-acetyltransferase